MANRQNHRSAALPPYRHCSGSVSSSPDRSLALHLRNVLSVIKHILTIAAVTLATANLTFAAECYRNGRRLYVPDGLNYPRQAWAGWGISCRTPKPEIAAGSGATAAESGGQPVEWCGWWMRQHLGGHYGPEFNVARNWLNVGRPLDVLAPVPLVSRLIMCSRWFGLLIRDMCWRSPAMTIMPFRPGYAQRLM